MRHLLHLALGLGMCLAPSAVAFWVPFWGGDCGRNIAGRGAQDETVRALQDPQNFRERLFREASERGYDLSRVPVPEARGQLKWMRDLVSERLSKLERSWFAVGHGTVVRQAALRHTLGQLDLALSKPQPSYQEVISSAGLFASFYHRPRNTRTEISLGQGILKQVPLTASDFPFPELVGSQHPVLLSVGGEQIPLLEEPGPELSEYVLVPLAQDLIHQYIEGDVFLRAWAYRVYPIGLTPHVLHVHDQDEDAVGFADHDLLHARLSYRAWKRMKYLATADKVDPHLRSWYARTYSEAERHIEQFIESKNRIEDSQLRAAVGDFGWHLFHESRIPINALDAYQLVYLAEQNQNRGRLYDVLGGEAFRKIHRKVNYATVTRWHLDFWRGLLPQENLQREELLKAHEALLCSEGFVRRRGEIRYPIGGH